MTLTLSDFCPLSRHFRPAGSQAQCADPGESCLYRFSETGCHNSCRFAAQHRGGMPYTGGQALCQCADPGESCVHRFTESGARPDGCRLTNQADNGGPPPAPVHADQPNVVVIVINQPRPHPEDEGPVLASE